MILSGTNFLWIKELPFAYVLEHPMQTYLGVYDLNKSLLYFFGGVVWAIFILFLTQKFFYFGLKKYESVGL